MFPRLANYDLVLILIGMLMVFPSLAKFATRSFAWGKVEVTVKALGKVGERVTVMADSFMKDPQRDEGTGWGNGSPKALDRRPAHFASILFHFFVITITRYNWVIVRNVRLEIIASVTVASLLNI